MLFMKEMRQKVIDECTLKESAAINQILGRKVILLCSFNSDLFHLIIITRKLSYRKDDRAMRHIL